MGKLTSIDRIERLAGREQKVAIRELRLANTFLRDHLEGLAKEYPGVLGIGVIVYGKVSSIFTLAESASGLHCSPIAPHLIKALANIVGRLPFPLRDVFEAELAQVPRAAVHVHFVSADEIAADDETYPA